jgi:hypothetical protein
MLLPKMSLGVEAMLGKLSQSQGSRQKWLYRGGMPGRPLEGIDAVHIPTSPSPEFGGHDGHEE